MRLLRWMNAFLSPTKHTNHWIRTGRRTDHGEIRYIRSIFSLGPTNNKPNFLFVFRYRAPKGAHGCDRCVSENSRVSAWCAPFRFLISSWGAMDYRYILEVMGGARRLLRMLPGSARKTEYRRKALAPGAEGRPRWEFPTVRLMVHHAGCWQSIAFPKMEGGAPKSIWKATIRSPIKPIRAAGDPPPPQPTHVKDKNDAYPSCTPLQADEIKLALNYHHRPIEGASIASGALRPIPDAKIRSRSAHAGNTRSSK